MAKTKLISDSAMNSPTVMSEDEKEENDDNGIRRAKTPECLEYDEKYWFEVFASQTVRSQSSRCLETRRNARRERVSSGV